MQYYQENVITVIQSDNGLYSLPNLANLSNLTSQQESNLTSQQESQENLNTYLNLID